MEYCHLELALSSLWALFCNPLLTQAFSDPFVAKREELIKDLFKEMTSFQFEKLRLKFKIHNSYFLGARKEGEKSKERA